LFDILNFDKAAIAKLWGTGSGVGDMVTWKTSDPASGTVVSYTNDGAANTGFVSEQTEPLGQSVAVTDPEPPNEPQTYEQHLFFASDPEWQCEAAGLGAYGNDLMARPDHCQDRVLMNLNIPLAQTFGWHPASIVSFSWKRSGGTGVSVPPILQPGRKHSKEEIAEFRRLAAEGKFDNEAVSDPSIPTDDGQRLNVSGGDTLYPWNPLVKTRRMSDVEVETLRQNVKKALDANDGACAAYVAKLLAKTTELSPNGEDGGLKKSNFVLRNADVMGIFGLVNEQGGFYYAYGNTTSGFKDKPEFGGARVWLFGGNDIDPTTRTSPQFSTPFGEKLSRALDSYAASTTIHELLHFNFTDSQLAQATAKLNGDANPDFSGRYGPSAYWNAELRKHCDSHYVPAAPRN